MLDPPLEYPVIENGCSKRYSQTVPEERNDFWLKHLALIAPAEPAARLALAASGDALQSNANANVVATLELTPPPPHASFRLTGRKIINK